MIERQRHTTNARFSRSLAAIGLASLVTIAGCAASGVPAYRQHYDAGRYELALAGARAKAGQPGGVDEASLIVGMAAQASGDDETARQWLEPIVRGGPVESAAHARATLALIDLRRGRPRTAAMELDGASQLMSGRDAREAARLAAEAYDRAGMPDDAKRLRRRSVGMTDGVGPITGRAYTIQVGAFSTRQRASQRLGEMLTAARASGLGEPRIEIGGTATRPLYTVRIGQFPNEFEAARAQRLLGVDAIVTDTRR